MKWPRASIAMRRIWSPPSRGAWIEIMMVIHSAGINGSPPSRGAWIEMFERPARYKCGGGRPLAGGVD